MFDNKLNLNTDFEVSGIWWINDNKGHTLCAGTLIRKDNMTILRLQSNYHYDDSELLILGEAEGKKFSIFKPILNKRSYKTDINIFEFLVPYCMIGKSHYENKNDLNSLVAKVDLDSLEFWFSPGSIKQESNNIYVEDRKSGFKINISDFTLTFQPSMGSYHQEHPLKFKVKTGCKLILTYDEKVNINKIFDDIWRIKTFIIFIFRMPISLKRLQVSTKPESSTINYGDIKLPVHISTRENDYIDVLITRDPYNVDKFLNNVHYGHNCFYNAETLFKTNSESNYNFGEALFNNWYKFCVDHKTAVSTFMKYSLNKELLSPDIQFLYLTTTFESLYAIENGRRHEVFTKESGFTNKLRKRLRYIKFVEKLYLEFYNFKSIFTEYKSFEIETTSNRIKDIRNQIAHIGDVSDSNMEYLHNSVITLRLLVECMFLRVLRLSIDEIKKLVFSIQDYIRLDEVESYRITF